jgi:hypothetical protein
MHWCIPQIFDRSQNTTTVLTESWDRSISTVSWSRDGSYLVAEVLDVARTKLFKVTLSGSITMLVGENSNTAANVLPDQSIVFSRDVCTIAISLSRSLVGWLVGWLEQLAQLLARGVVVHDVTGKYLSLDACHQ